MCGLARSDVAGFLLAGGQSSRMGANKALLRFGGELLVERGLRLLGEVCSTVALAGGDAALARFAPVISDRSPGQGPLSGIVQALEHSTFEWNLFLAVDMPLLPVPALRALLLSAGEPCLITLAQAEGIVQPLCGVYARRALPILREQLLLGNRRVRTAVEATASYRYWQAPHLSWFANVNTPEEFAEAERLAGFRDSRQIG